MRLRLRPSRLTTVLVAGATCLAAALGAVTPAVAAPSAADDGGLSERTARQINVLQRVKAAQSKAESKVDSRLVVEQRLRQDRSLLSAAPELNTGIAVGGNGSVLVEIRADRVGDELVADVRRHGGVLRHVSPATRTVRAELPLSSLAKLAARGDVRQIEPASEAMTARAGAPKSAETKEARGKRIAEQARAALAAKQQRAGVAAVTSEGDRAHNADNARRDYKVTGVGAKLCAMSDGVDSLAAMRTLGELPAVDVLAGQEGDGDEGTAMLEILHDVAPGASLGFATAFNGDASFADNIRKLRFELKCDVIVDDVLYFNESPFQDGIIAQAVNDVTAHGALFFSSAGNEGNLADGTSGHWEGKFVDSGKGVGRFVGTAHDFDPGAGVQIINPMSAGSNGKPVTLFWADPLQRSTNDYDLYLLDGNGNVVALSQGVQDGLQDPYERVNTTAGGQRLAVVKYRGEDKYLSLSVLRGRFKDAGELKGFATSGVTRGHSAAKDAFSVAAAPAAKAFTGGEAGDPANPAGPYPGSFDGSSKLERFSSDGPRRVFFNADGTPVASPEGELRQKPDLTAADGVVTKTPGFSPFYGTSAAAPHAAAIAGLILSGNPGLPAAEVRQALTSTAVDIGAPGVDNRAGAGIVLTDKVLAHTGASPQPRAVAQSPTVSPTSGDGDAFLEPGESAALFLPVLNNGDGTAASVSVALTATSPGVTVAPRTKNYGTIEAGQTGLNQFAITVPASHPIGDPVVLSAKVTFAGSLSPTTTALNIPIGRPSPVAKNFAYAGEPVAIPDGDSAGVTVTIPVTGAGRPSKVTFSLDGTDCSAAEGSTTAGISHTYVGDLAGTLTSPSGQVLTLFQRQGGGGNNLCQVVFDDGAAQPFSGVTAAQAPFTGTWRPVAPLAPTLRGTADGNWTLKVVDNVRTDAGHLRNVSLHINGYE
ncbi:S8 family serine peptidase [Crossiella sp. CA-258035]|uniref:S8 family serine peptidase n=1 Tax=Crossiella sp. CA-258035 TaxID=2981138 RepID=UPI0024BCAA5F|nr:S8 family serine peptidase [Crossiella sp. CA-258035]WHT16926.1 S8 family serine peptidase [Crossiella sp. CA-258035]